jgi:hypothetical protein
VTLVTVDSVEWWCEEISEKCGQGCCKHWELWCGKVTDGEEMNILNTVLNVLQVLPI